MIITCRKALEVRPYRCGLFHVLRDREGTTFHALRYVHFQLESTHKDLMSTGSCYCILCMYIPQVLAGGGYKVCGTRNPQVFRLMNGSSNCKLCNRMFGFCSFSSSYVLTSWSMLFLLRKVLYLHIGRIDDEVEYDIQ